MNPQDNQKILDSGGSLSDLVREAEELLKKQQGEQAKVLKYIAEVDKKFNEIEKDLDKGFRELDGVEAEAEKELDELMTKRAVELAEEEEEDAAATG